MHELHVRAIEALAEHIHVHQHLNLTLSEVLHHLLAQLGWRLAVNSDGIHTFIIIVFGDVPCVADADSIHDAFLAVGILPHACIQPLDAWPSVQHGVHFLHLKVPVRAPFL